MARYEIDNLPAPIDFQGRNTVPRIIQNAKNLLMCRMNEVPYGRDRGFNPMLFDLPITELRSELLPELDLVMELEPRVEVQSAEASLLRDGTTYIKVILETSITEEGD